MSVTFSSFTLLFLAEMGDKTQLVSMTLAQRYRLGPLVAGVVGTKKYVYDIWGPTVNIAARMESSGEPDKLNISGSMYLRIKDQFDCAYRGKISAKNVGDIDMYFVRSNN